MPLLNRGRHIPPSSLNAVITSPLQSVINNSVQTKRSAAQQKFRDFLTWFFARVSSFEPPPVELSHVLVGQRDDQEVPEVFDGVTGNAPRTTLRAHGTRSRAISINYTDLHLRSY